MKRSNIYWGDGLAPASVRYRIKTELARPAFRRFLKLILKEGIYYDHGCNNGMWWVEMAFESEAQMKIHAVIFEAKAANANVLKK